MSTLLKILILVALAGAVAGTGFIYSGVYNIGADAPHWPLTVEVIDTLRERSIGARAWEVDVPDLDDASLLAEGAVHYRAMCSGCHSAPGMDDTEIRVGLYPQPPNLSEYGQALEHEDSNKQSARQFWIIKHGIKMTAMPAWGTTHDDHSIWGLVAFLQKMPGMTQMEYAALSGEVGHHDRPGQDSGEAGDHPAHQHGDSVPAPAVHVDAPDTPPHSHGVDKHSEDTHEGGDHLQGL